MASRLHHPNLVRAIDFCAEPPAPYLVMELVEGDSVGKRLECKGRLPEVEAIAIIVQVASGLQCAHQQGMLHRDVKPDNILVTPGGLAKLTDLGLAKDCAGGSELTRAGKGLGTPDYMPPEQFRDAAGATARGDIYALAATLYEMVTGHLPFGSRSAVETLMRKLKNDFPAPRQLVPELSARTDRAIRRAMCADPAARPATCAEFVEDLTGARGNANKIAQAEGVSSGGADTAFFPFDEHDEAQKVSSFSDTGFTSGIAVPNTGGVEENLWSLILTVVLAAGVIGWWLLS
jgi:serine/threonine protein kinase